MSTYTNFSIPIKENLTRLRNPGCTNDGTCPDRVLFTNPENEYCGKLMGSMLISNCRIDSCDISDSTFHYEGLSGNDMTFNISDLISISSNTNDIVLSTHEIIQSFTSLTNVSCLQSISISSSLHDTISALICIKDMLSSMYNIVNSLQPSANFEILNDVDNEKPIQKQTIQNKNAQNKTIQNMCVIQDKCCARDDHAIEIKANDERDEMHDSCHHVNVNNNVLSEICKLRKENSELLQENDGYLIKISELVFENAQLKSQLNTKK